MCLRLALTLECIFALCSITEIFPQVSFNFAGGASMVLGPEEYLLQQSSTVSFLDLTFFLSVFQRLKSFLDIHIYRKLWSEFE